MTKRSIVILIILFSLLSIPLLHATTINDKSKYIPSQPFFRPSYAIRSKEESHTTHDPIYINGNDGFTPENGVVRGNGSLESPFVIENWDIDIEYTGSGIVIENADAYFAVSNCLVYNSSSEGGSSGIALNSVMNGRIEKNTLWNNRFAVALADSQYNMVVDNQCEANYRGIEVSGSDDNQITDNVCYNNKDMAVNLHESHHNTIDRNYCSDSRYFFGINIYSSDYNNISNNVCNGNEFAGIVLQRSTNNTVFNNSCEKNGFNGIELDHSSYNVLSENTCDHNYENGIDIDYPDSVHNIFDSNTCMFNDVNGIDLIYSTDNIVSNNLCQRNKYDGIVLSDITDTRVYNNTVHRNGRYGLVLGSGTRDNLVYNNNLVNNVGGHQEAYDFGTGNRWNTSSSGNYWGDYVYLDNGAEKVNGVWDMPYGVGGNSGAEDHFPRVQPHGQITNTPPAPPNSVSPRSTHDLTPGISWNAGHDPDGDPIRYFLRLENETGEETLGWTYTGTNTYYQIETELELGIFYIQIKAHDGWGFSEVFEETMKIISLDLDPPSISHEPASNVEVGVPLTIEAGVFDEKGVGAVHLIYTDLEGTEHNLSMFHSSGTLWEYEIADLDSLGWISYRICANDSSDNWNCTPVCEVEIIDDILPSIVNISWPESIRLGEELIVMTEVVDNYGISGVGICYTDVEARVHNHTMAQIDGNRYRYIFPPQNHSGTIGFHLWTVDSANNTNKTGRLTIEILPKIMPDTYPPHITNLSIRNGSANVSVNIGQIVVEFNESMNTGSVESSLVISPAAPYEIKWNNENVTMFIDLMGNLTFNTTYYMEIGKGAKDVKGNNLVSGFWLEFRTERAGIKDGRDGEEPDGETYPKDDVNYTDGKRNGLEDENDEIISTFIIVPLVILCSIVCMLFTTFVYTRWNKTERLSSRPRFRK